MQKFAAGESEGAGTAAGPGLNVPGKESLLEKTGLGALCHLLTSALGSWEEAEMEAGFPLKAPGREGSTEGRSRADPGIQGRKRSLPLTRQQGCHPWKAATSDRAVISQQSRRAAHPHLLCSQCQGMGGMEVTPVSISLSLLWNPSRAQQGSEKFSPKAPKLFTL